MNNFFKVLQKSSKSKARLGEIKTSHGVIKTPAFAPCATKGTVKSLTPRLVKEIKTQVAFVNTYHLVTHPGADIIEASGGIHKYSQLNMPLMSDSGGFQVFSLARNKRIADVHGEEQPLVVKISEDGVKFRSTYDGALIEFTPEASMEFQRKIGTDINMAFDECTYYPATHRYAEKAMKRTHEWLKRCILAKSKIQNPKSQINSKSQIKNPKRLEFKNLNLFGTCNLEFRTYLYGVIQGATFEDLRKKSAKFVVSQNTPGVAIGGVSVGESKSEMRDQVRWISDYLPSDRPVHLLGVGQIDDIVDLVKYGIDTFDCSEPTRLARMGKVYSWKQILSRVAKEEGFLTARSDFSSLPLVASTGRKESFDRTREFDIDIYKLIYKSNFEPIDESCNCYVCKNFTKSYLHHLFKQREILGYTLATYHNLWTMEKLFEKIRELISENKI